MQAVHIIVHHPALFLGEAQDGFVQGGIQILGWAQGKAQWVFIQRLGGGHQRHPHRTGAPRQHSLQDGLDCPFHFQRGGHPLADQQELVEFFQAGMHADSHLLEGMPELTHLVHAPTQQRLVQLAAGDPPGFDRQSLQRGGQEAETQPQRYQQSHRQDEDEHDQRRGDIERQLLRLLRRDLQDHRPRTAFNRLIVGQAARPAGRGDIIELALAALCTRSSIRPGWNCTAPALAHPAVCPPRPGNSILPGSGGEVGRTG